jgi:hypothetical protein
MGLNPWQPDGNRAFVATVGNRFWPYPVALSPPSKAIPGAFWGPGLAGGLASVKPGHAGESKGQSGLRLAQFRKVNSGLALEPIGKDSAMAELTGLL